MSEPTTFTTEQITLDGPALLSERCLMIPADLPPGSVITLTITIGPPPAPEPAPPEPVKSRYLGIK